VTTGDVPRPRGRLTLGTLFTGQALGLSGAPLVVMVGSIVGQDLAPRSGLATLPLATMVVGTAAAAGPVALLMQRVGRRLGFSAGGGVAIMGAALAAWAVEAGSFTLFSLATLLLGASSAAVQQYRFAAAEVGGPDGSGRAVALVLTGGIVAGVLGPEIGRRARDLTATPWVGSFLTLSVVYLALVGILLLGLPDDRPASGERSSRGTDSGPSRALRGPSVALRSTPEDGAAPRPRPLATPSFLVAVAAGVTAYSVMSLAMTAAPLAMHGVGHGVDATAIAIQAHVIAMSAPSLVSGALVSRLGLRRLMAAGVVLLLASVTCARVGDGVSLWVASLVLLGLGWNLLFLGGTVALALAYPGRERFRAQALNDLLVFGTQALASLGSGFLLAVGGWAAIQAVALAPLVGMGLLLGLRLPGTIEARRPA